VASIFDGNVNKVWFALKDVAGAIALIANPSVRKAWADQRAGVGMCRAATPIRVVTGNEEVVFSVKRELDVANVTSRRDVVWPRCIWIGVRQPRRSIIWIIVISISLCPSFGFIRLSWCGLRRLGHFTCVDASCLGGTSGLAFSQSIL